MDGLSNLIGPRLVELRIAGAKYSLRTMALGDLADRERIVLGLRPDPAEVMARIPLGLPQPVFDQLLQDFQREATWGVFVDGQTAGQFDRSPRGLAVRFWTVARHEHPGLTPDDAARLVGRLVEEQREDELRRALAAAEEADILQTIRGDEDDDDSEPESDGRRRRRVPWAKLLLALAKDHGRTMEEIRGMTLFRLHWLLGGRIPEHVRWVTRHD